MTHENDSKTAGKSAELKSAEADPSERKRSHKPKHPPFVFIPRFSFRPSPQMCGGSGDGTPDGTTVGNAVGKAVGTRSV